MPATRRNTAQASRTAAPYSLSGVSKPELAELTVSALKSHLKHFKLSVSGRKADLVDRLFTHVESLQGSSDNSDTNNTSTSLPTGATGAQSNAVQVDTANNQHATGLSPQQFFSQLATIFQQAQNPPTTNPPPQQSGGSLPQQLLDQLATVFQQSQNPPASGAPQTDTMDDDCLSAASMPVQPSRLPTNRTTPANPPSSAPVTAGQLTLSTRTLPPIPSRIYEKILKGEYIDFTTLLRKSMFGAVESQSQTLTLQLNPSGDNYFIRPQSAPNNRKISSFAAWMEAWNVYLAVRISINPACAPQLMAYQRIITTANSDHPLNAWISYDIKFRTKAANDPTLRWDVRELDLWLECFPGTSAQPNRWPCNHCGSTTHFPANCPFRAYSSRAPGGPPPTSINFQQRAPGGMPPTFANFQQHVNAPRIPVCRDFNRSRCHRENCRFSHRCERCGGPHPGKSCFAQGQPWPR